MASVWISHATFSGHCDGIAVFATPGDITMLSQPDPHYSHPEDLRHTVVLLDPSLVASVANGVPGRRASSPIRFTGFAPADAAAQRVGQATGSHVQAAVLAGDTLATP